MRRVSGGLPSCIIFGAGTHGARIVATNETYVELIGRGCFIRRERGYTVQCIVWKVHLRAM